MRLEIPDVPPSLNKVLRMHWATKRRLARNWEQSIWLALVNGHRAYLKPFVKMRCKMTLVHSRLYDKDNAYGAAKVLVDVLKNWQLIVDDSPKYLDLTVEQEKCPHKKRHTVIELEPA